MTTQPPQRGPWTARDVPRQRRRPRPASFVVGLLGVVVLLGGVGLGAVASNHDAPLAPTVSPRTVASTGAVPAPKPLVASSDPAVAPSATEPQIPPRTPTVPTPELLATPSDPAVLWVVGDSLTETFGPALVEAATATGVIHAHHQLRYSSGLTRPDFYDWPQRLRELIVPGTDIVVFMIGANDAQAIDTGAGWVEFGTKAWTEEYRQRVVAAADLLASRSRTAYWVGQPIARPTRYGERMALLNSVYADVAAQHDTIRYVSSWELFSGPDGGYSADLLNEDGLWVRVRGVDGIHLSTSGGGRLATHVLDEIRQDWSLRSADDRTR